MELSSSLHCLDGIGIHHNTTNNNGRMLAIFGEVDRVHNMRISLDDWHKIP
jgi:hypothetical protein